jgi:ribose 5-phosphate isomerase A
MPPSPADRAKRAAAAAAIGLVRDGMKLGLGSGSTARFFVELLADRLAETGWRITCVPTSSGTKELADRLGVPLVTLDEAGPLDLAVDGADELDDNLDLIKGGGGALLLEKIVARAAGRFVVIADASKHVGTLGAFPLPVEVVRFGWRTTARHVAEALRANDVGGHEVRLRERDGEPFVTDEGHYILDLSLGRIGEPGVLEFDLAQIPGVVETGLFLGMADAAILGHEDGTTRTIARDA